MKWHEAGFQRHVLVAEDGEIVQTIVRNADHTGHWTVQSNKKTYITMAQAMAQALALVDNHKAQTYKEFKIGPF